MGLGGDHRSRGARGPAGRGVVDLGRAGRRAGAAAAAVPQPGVPGERGRSASRPVSRCSARLAFLPLYLQVVRGVSPTISGVYLLPMVLGLLLTSVASGQLISRLGRYRIYPIIGTAVVTIALYLLSRLTETTSTLQLDARLFVLGLRPRADPAGAGHRRAELRRLRRSRRGDLGRHVLPVDRRLVRGGHLRLGLREPAGRPSWPPRCTARRCRPGSRAGSGASRAQIDKLPPPLRAGVLHAYTQAIDRVFLVAVPVAAAAFVLVLVPARGAAAGHRRGLRPRRGPGRGLGAAVVGRGGRAGAAPAGRQRPAPPRLRAAGPDNRARPARRELLGAGPAGQVRAAGRDPSWPARPGSAWTTASPTSTGWSPRACCSARTACWR